MRPRSQSANMRMLRRDRVATTWFVITFFSLPWPSIAGSLDDALLIQKQELVFTVPSGWSDKTAVEDDTWKLRTEERHIVQFQRFALFDQTLSQWIRDAIDSYRRKYPKSTGSSDRTSKGFELVTPPKAYATGQLRWTMFSWEKPYVERDGGRPVRELSSISGKREVRYLRSMLPTFRNTLIG